MLLAVFFIIYVYLDAASSFSVIYTLLHKLILLLLFMVYLCIWMLLNFETAVEDEAYVLYFQIISSEVGHGKLHWVKFVFKLKNFVSVIPLITSVVKVLYYCSIFSFF